MSDFDIIVVGGGMTGSAVALGAAQQGWRVALVEAAPVSKLVETPALAHTVNDFEPRVSAISVASQRLLEDLDAWQRTTRTRHCPYRAMDVWDGEAIGRIRFDAAELGVPALGTIVENRHLVRGLFEAVQGSEVTCLDNQTVEGMTATVDDGWQVDLSGGDNLSARLVVGADGAHSRIRQWAGLPTREWDYDQQAIVCTVQTELSHQYTAWQRFTPTGPLAFLPLQADDDQGGHFCSIVWSQDTPEARGLLGLDDIRFMVSLTQALEGRLGQVVATSRRHAFPLRQRHSKQYVQPGLALVGDAAHTIHPLAGQGANLGYGDVSALLAELAGAFDRRQSPGELMLLQRYQRRRKGENLAMMAAMEGFKQLFARDELPLRWLRSTGMRWLDRASPLKNRVAAEAMGL